MDSINISISNLLCCGHWLSFDYGDGGSVQNEKGIQIIYEWRLFYDHFLFRHEINSNHQMTAFIHFTFPHPLSLTLWHSVVYSLCFKFIPFIQYTNHHPFYFMYSLSVMILISLSLMFCPHDIFQAHSYIHRCSAIPNKFTFKQMQFSHSAIWSLFSLGMHY